MRADIVLGGTFPDYELTDQDPAHAERAARDRPITSPSVRHN